MSLAAEPRRTQHYRDTRPSLLSVPDEPRVARPPKTADPDLLTPRVYYEASCDAAPLLSPPPTNPRPRDGGGEELKGGRKGPVYDLKGDEGPRAAPERGRWREGGKTEGCQAMEEAARAFLGLAAHQRVRNRS